MDTKQRIHLDLTIAEHIAVYISGILWHVQHQHLDIDILKQLCHLFRDKLAGYTFRILVQKDT